eukprot:GEMP01114347.1.p1 GENE.GEMP01114347.1~~GEMP01114347.1.p1  ORF type:complete len:101 (+),score=10.83 GEMP01114347.1:266-568(+)
MKERSTPLPPTIEDQTHRASPRCVDDANKRKRKSLDSKKTKMMVSKHQMLQLYSGEEWKQKNKIKNILDKLHLFYQLNRRHCNMDHEPKYWHLRPNDCRA